MDASVAHQHGEAVLDELSRAVIVERDVLRTILTGVMANGHVLLEDVPGTGKTLTARSFATVLGLSFNRIQFTPDLLPADVTGTFVFNERSREFDFSEGPLFANVVLADEINRASPKTQAALLEAMEEGQVTVDGETFPLPDPFFVIATQNPVERGEGTFPLPEAQKDRFLVKSSIGYPDEAGELELINRRAARETSAPTVSQQLGPEDVRGIRQAPEHVRVHDDVKQYVVDLVRATREDGRVDVGVSPRGCQRLFEVARAWAAVGGRAYVTPDDVADIAHPVLDHRLVLTADATVNDVDRSTVIDDLLDQVHVPTLKREAPR
ncbi:AAA family ATPase (plasmid) [Halorarum halophilum]|uniref:AAA family ATPase n=1 Tax=Halorarum halophilum TaxID=2743090 RepID=A0A7D5GP50_9EURY|nr:MoxR family ATPase [Halobaculum halophilum]QLG29727.1 AAA family ATPase [Halobaculum halophilum]